MYQDLPARIEQRISERPIRSRRHINSSMMMEFADYLSHREDPLSILVMSSIFRNDVPWLYESGLEVYRAVKSGDSRKVDVAFHDFERIVELTMSGPFLEEIDISPRIIEITRHVLERIVRANMHRKHTLDGEKEQTQK